MFTPVESALGALLLQQASTTLLFSNGCILGASGQLRGLLTGPSSRNIAFVLGMALSLFIVKTLFPTFIPEYPDVQQNWHDSLWIVGAGVLTGYGTKVSAKICCVEPLGSSCSSGTHKWAQIELQWLHFRSYVVRYQPSFSTVSDCYTYFHDHRLHDAPFPGAFH